MEKEMEKKNYQFMRSPIIGDIIHYQKYGTPGGEHLSEPSPAIITKIIDVDNRICQLFIMNPNGLYFNLTPYSTDPCPGHWNWPEIPFTHSYGTEKVDF